MTDRERVEALLRHEKPDRVPLFPFAAAGFSTVHTKASVTDAYNKPEVSLAAQRRTSRGFGWVFAPMLGYAGYGGWEFGGEIKWPGSEFAQAPSISRRAVQSEADVWNLKPPPTGRRYLSAIRASSASATRSSYRRPPVTAVTG